MGGAVESQRRPIVSPASALANSPAAGGSGRQRFLLLAPRAAPTISGEIAANIDAVGAPWVVRELSAARSMASPVRGVERHRRGRMIGHCRPGLGHGAGKAVPVPFEAGDMERIVLPISKQAPVADR